MANVKPAEGKLGILVVGCGAVSTTFMTGVLMARKGLAKPVGSMTQYDKIRVGKGENKKYLAYGDIVPLTNLNDIVFGTWDVYPQNAYQAAMYAEVLKEKDINPVREELEQIVPMKAAFDKNYAKRLDGDNVKDAATRWEMVEQLREDIRSFKEKTAAQESLLSGLHLPKSTYLYMSRYTARSPLLKSNEGRRPRAHRTVYVLCLRRTRRGRSFHNGCS